MVGKQLKSDKNSIKWGLIIGIFLVFFAGPVLAYDEWLIDFEINEGYSVGPLEASGWSLEAPYYPNTFRVYDVEAFSGNQSVIFNGEGELSANYRYTIPGFTISENSGIWYFSARVKTTITPTIWSVQLWPSAYNFLIGLYNGTANFNTFKFNRATQQYIGIEYNFTPPHPINEWIQLVIKMDLENRELFFYYDFGEGFELIGDYENYFYWLNSNWQQDLTLNSIFAFTGYTTQSSLIWDKIVFSQQSPFEPPPAKVFGISPESGSTITNLEDEFVVGWEGLPEGTNFITLNFINEATGITEGAGAFFIEGTSGEKSFTFSNFNFEKNGLFRLFASGGIKIGLIFFPVWLEVSPPYYINLNIEGLPGYFQMPNFLEWYQENAMFNEPTAIFSAVAGFISPLYDKIGEFGDRVSVFLNTDDAYNYGYNLGLVFPTFRHYINEIEVFFGGFPIITIFLVILILFLAIFIFRLILKFIPGLG